MPLRLANLEEPIPGYRLIERLGRGGFGEVWKAEAPGGLLKAIKFVYGELDAVGEDSRAAEQEWKALNRVKTIRHPYILSLERFDVIEGQLLIVMELADRSLWDRFRECRSQNLTGIPRDELLSYLEEAAEALDLMNNQYQLQHLDIKPQNLFLVHNHVKVADFGLAKDLEGLRATVTGGVTPVYAAPETFDGWISRFSDQYSLAIVYQELLTGSRPFNGTNTRQLLMQHISGVPDLSSLPELERPIIARSLAKKPDERYPSCAELIDALLKVGRDPAPPVHAPAPSTVENGKQSVPSVSGVQTQPMANAATRESRPATPAAPSASSLKTPPTLRGPGMPSLVTQSQLLRDQGIVDHGTNLSAKLTHQRPPVAQTGRMHDLGIAPPEQTGNGVLFPALVIGLGNTGLIVLQQLRQAVYERFGPEVTLPHLRYLHIDTDADTLQEATAAPPPQALSPKEVVLARLHRPAHYLKREGLPPVDSWLSSHLLYRLPRNPATVGVRAFGRLALCDNYRSIVVRLRQEIEGFLQTDSLNESDRQTRLGLRSNRPRIYIITALGGGTGGGMFLDLAYILRHELRSVGFSRPHVTGMFFLPRVDRSVTKSQAVANAHAALLELNHFSSPGACFETKYDNREPPIVDAEPPFHRAVFLNLPKANELKPLRLLANQAAGSLFQELLTPASRAIEDHRNLYWNNHPQDGLRAQTFGIFRLTWPRQRLLEVSARKFAQGMMVRWMAKNVEELREPVTTWLQEEWERRQLDLESLVNRLRYTPQAQTQVNGDQIFKSLLESLQQSTQVLPDSYAACVLLDQVFRSLGKPDSEKEGTPNTIGDLFSVNSRQIISECERKLAEMAVYFIEEPMFRLSGAEEAIQQLSGKLKSTLDTLEPLAVDLFDELSETHSKLFPLIASLDNLANDRNGKIRATVSSDVIERIKTYVQTRYRYLTVQSAIAIYRSLLSNAPEYLREVNFCRLRLSEIARHIAEMSRTDVVDSARGPGQYILPPGCRNIEAAADQFLQTLPAEDLREFDKIVQSHIRRQFRALVNICLETNDHSPALKAILEEQATIFLNKRLENTNPIAVFFRYRPELQQAQREIRQAFDESTPELAQRTTQPGTQTCLLAVPNDDQSETFRELARDVLIDEELVLASSNDDIVFYREQLQLRLSELALASSTAHECYEYAKQPDQMAPHSRTDIQWRDLRAN